MTEKKKYNISEIRKKVDAAIQEFQSPENIREIREMEKRLHNLSPKDLLTKMTV